MLRDWSKINKNDIKDLKTFKNSLIFTLIVTVLVIANLVASYLYKVGTEGFAEYTIVGSTVIDVILVAIGFYYRRVMITYINNYKRARSILDKTKIKKEV